MLRNQKDRQGAESQQDRLGYQERFGMGKELEEWTDDEYWQELDVIV